LNHKRRLTSVALSPDGQRIATASAGSVLLWDVQTGESLSEPLGPIEDRLKVTSLEFSLAGKRIIAMLENNHTWSLDIAPSGAGCPGWLIELTEAISGQTLDKQGRLVRTAGDRVELLRRVRQKVELEQEAGDWLTWGRWFLADPRIRTISPFSARTLPQYVKDLIKQKTRESLDVAGRVAFGETDLLAQIRHEQSLLPLPPTNLRVVATEDDP